ncbi:hypothetical protein AADR41_42415 [Streptomyces sp. CLV115]|uniref:hypothetical protein n=1 Tax=Streptomyces sp. CLV115 TaxID=3138502 RepID=UPI00313E2D39
MTLNFETNKTVSEKWIQVPGPDNDMTFGINPDYKPIVPDEEFVNTNPRCKNCKFWGTEWKWSSDEDKICSRFRGHINDGYGTVIIKPSNGGVEVDVAFPPDFGCIHFEVKDGEINNV